MQAFFNIAKYSLLFAVNHIDKHLSIMYYELSNCENNNKYKI